MQSALNPPLIAAVRNKCFHKPLYNLDTPNEELIKENFDNFQVTQMFFEKHFLKGGPFLGESKIMTIGDLLAANTLEQVCYCL